MMREPKLLSILTLLVGVDRIFTNEFTATYNPLITLKKSASRKKQ